MGHSTLPPELWSLKQSWRHLRQKAWRQGLEGSDFGLSNSSRQIGQVVAIILFLCFSTNTTSTTRRLATANKSRVSTRITKTFGQGRGVVDHVKVFLSSSLITMQNLLLFLTPWAHMPPPPAAGKANAGVAHSACGWNSGWAGKIVISLDDACYMLSALEMFHV